MVAEKIQNWKMHITVENVFVKDNCVPNYMLVHKGGNLYGKFSITIDGFRKQRESLDTSRVKVQNFQNPELLKIKS